MASWRAFLGSARTIEEAQEGLRVTALGCYPFTALALACGLSKVPEIIPLATALALPTFFIAVAYFLPRRASRTLACILLAYGLYFTAQTGAIGLRLTVFGVIDFVFSILAIWMGVQAVRLTFKYHHLLGTRIRWENVWTAWSLEVVIIVVGLLLVGGIMQNNGVSLGIQEWFNWSFVLVTSILVFVVRTQRRPLAVLAGRPKVDAPPAGPRMIVVPGADRMVAVPVGHPLAEAESVPIGDSAETGAPREGPWVRDDEPESLETAAQRAEPKSIGFLPEPDWPQMMIFFIP